MDRRVAARKFEKERVDLIQLRYSGLEKTFSFKEISYPLVKVHLLDDDGVARIGVKVDCTDYNYMPPSITYTDLDFKPLRFESIPIRTHYPSHLQNIVRQHPVTKLPFLCLKGIREYHTHPQHGNDPWDTHRYRGYNIYHAIRASREELDFDIKRPRS